MKRAFIILCSLFLFFVTLSAVSGLWLTHALNAPASFETDQEFLVEPGTSGYGIAQKLGEQNLIAYPDLFYVMLRLRSGVIQAGEYAIPARSSMKSVLAQLQSGDVIRRQITVTEGMTVKQVIRLLNDTPHLTGTVSDPNDIPEGTLFPETYSYMRNETRDALIARMRKAHSDVVSELWATRDPSLPLKSINEMVTLASIVEKETGIAHERAKIAGLFYNRLKINMPLQTDPTVVYVLTDRLGHMEGKPLLRKAMQIDSPYNTYKVTGLPPGPIANPGRASLEAVLKPEKHAFLFFVADGTGGHVFAKTLAEHNRNVMKWRVIKRQRQ